MKIKTYIFLIIFAGLVYACNKKESNLKDMFPDKEKITGEPIPLTNKELLSSKHPMILMDSILIFTTYKSKEFLIKIYNIKTNSYIKDAIKQGRGPNEFIMGQFYYNGTGKKISFYSPVQRTLYRYHIDSLLKNNSYSPEKAREFEQDTGTGSVYKAIMIQDSLFLCTGYFSEHRFALMNKKNVIQTTGKYPDDGKKVSYKVKSAAYQNILRQNSDGSKFVSYTPLAGILDIYNINKNHITEVKKLHFHYSKYKMVNGGPNRGKSASFKLNNKIGFINVRVTDSLIFALYTGKKIKNYKEGSMAFYANDIYIFNWQGEPVKHYHTSEDMARIEVKQNNNTIKLYALTVQPEPKLYKYKLSGLNN